MHHITDKDFIKTDAFKKYTEEGYVFHDLYKEGKSRGIDTVPIIRSQIEQDMNNSMGGFTRTALMEKPSLQGMTSAFKNMNPSEYLTKLVGKVETIKLDKASVDILNDKFKGLNLNASESIPKTREEFAQRAGIIPEKGQTHAQAL